MRFLEAENWRSLPYTGLMRDHRSLAVWQEARAVCLRVIEASKRHWHPWASALFAQLQRSALSVQLNLAEGASFGPSPTYTRHLGIAYGSAVETIELIELLLDAEAIPPDAGRHMLTKAKHTQQLLIGLLKRHRPM